jgi:hypothetical protein|tara:strand:+ start:2312 stop:2794 length:483 start_codon:yes stop_codon:yes gene_type:complete
MKVIPNFLEQKTFDQVKSCFFNNSFPWFFSPTTGDDNDFSDFLFSHHLYKDDKQSSQFFNYVLTPLISRLNFNYLIRAKANLYTRKHKHIKTNFHVDFTDKHTVALYSINTNNGYTLFENGKKVPSIENQMLIFDGSLAHASVSQTDASIRVNININLIQ